MNLIQRMRQALAPPQQKQRQPSRFVFWPKWREGQPEWHLTDLSSYIEEGFELNAVIYSAIMYKVRAAYGATLRAYEGTRDEPVLLDYGHPLAQLVDRPNSWQSFGELQAEMIVYFNLMGNAYVWYKRQSGSEYPEALYNLRPDWVRHIYDGQRLKGFLYVPSGVAVEDGTPMLPEDVMHVRLPNPADPYAGLGKGLSPISALARSADVDNEATHFLKQFFDDGAMPRGMLTVDAPLTQTIIDEAEERWMEAYGGRDKWIKPLITGHGAGYQRIGSTFAELDMDAIDARSESRIVMCFGVPLTLIESRPTLAQATYSNKEQDYKMFLDVTLLPELSMFETEWRYHLRFGDGREFAQYDYSEVPGFIDEQQRIDLVKEAWEGAAATRREYRQALGLPSTEADNVYKLPLAVYLVPADERSAAPRTEVGAEGAEEGQKALTVDKGNGKGYLAEEYKRAIWRMIDQKAESWEPQAKRVTRRAFEHDRREILAIVNETQKSAYREGKSVVWSQLLLGVQDYLRMAGKDNWRSEFLPILSAVVVDQGEQLNAIFGMQFDVRNLLAEDWFTSYTMTFADPITDTSNRTLHQIFERAMAEGWSVPDMQKAIDLTFDQWITGGVSPVDLEFALDRLPPWRLELIARTETMRASNYGATALYRNWGVSEREWLATIGDGRTRDTHLEAHGQVRGIDEPFVVGGAEMMQPGDVNAPLSEVANCRCTTIPVL